MGSVETAGGWMIGVLVEPQEQRGGKAGPARLFFAVAQADRARAEWAAADRAMITGVIASSPFGGMEPVEAVAELSIHAIASLGLGQGQIKAFGDKWPRRLLPIKAPAASDERD